ncbi:MAG TPA: dihydrolipoyl dehydrogenase [Syntrophomonas sp.]|jgi:dihydrolipoamide dehydrogenase|nr:dihydrolipoyl dehydrogenase [Syntrophomonas sp.]
MQDLVVIGGGPAGYVAAIRARQLGMTVTLVEKQDLGGTCLNRGCIPTKAFFQNAQVLHTLARLEEYNVKAAGIEFDLQAAGERKQRIVDNIVGGVVSLLKAYRVNVIAGKAVVADPAAVEVNGETISARHILIASGSIPARLLLPGADLPGVITSDEMLDLQEVPQHLTIIGGGVIGLEFACIYRAFGSQVTVLEGMPALLNTIDREIVKRMTVFLKKQGIAVHTGAMVKEICPAEAGLQAIWEDKKGSNSTASDVVLMAAGRKPFTAGLGLEQLGVEMNHGYIQVDENYATNIPGLYAVGDVVGKRMLAHVASEEAKVAVERMTGQPSRVNYEAVPACIFTFPEIAAVGLTEEEAVARGINIKTGRFRFAGNGKAVTMGEIDGMVKVVADDNDTIIGVHILGPHASDLILEATAMVSRGMKTEEVAAIIHPHPTLGEALYEAVMDVNAQAVHLAPR